MTHKFPDIKIQDKRAFRVNEFSAAYGISRTTIYNLMNEGKLKTVLVGGRRLIPKESAIVLHVKGYSHNASKVNYQGGA